MALVVEDGTGRADAESYLSAADADTYHTNHGSTGWSGSSAVKEAALRRATRYVDGHYRLRWKGFKRLRTQALEWPRYEVYDASGYDIDSDSVPTAVKNAVAEAALREVVSPGSLQPDLDRGGMVQAKTVSAGPVSSSTTYAPGATARKLFSVMDELLSALVRSSNMAKLVRS